MAACERVLRPSVLSATRTQPSDSKQCRRSRYFASVFAGVRQ